MIQIIIRGLPWWLSGKESACNAGTSGDVGSKPRSEKSPGGGARRPTTVFLLGESHGQRSLAGYSRYGHKELDRLKRFNTHEIMKLQNKHQNKNYSKKIHFQHTYKSKWKVEMGKHEIPRVYMIVYIIKSE